MLLLLVVVAGAVFVWFTGRKIAETRVLATSVEVIIPKGTGLNKTAALLEENGVVADGRLFVLYARWKGIGGKLKAGEYAFSGAVSVENAAEKILRGEVIVRSVTIPEGKSLAEIKKIVNDNPYLTGEITLSLQEGEILPETYHFTRGEQRDDILEKARRAMKKTLRATFLEMGKDSILKNERELLILASIVEKETGLSSERGKVASVFANRLKVGMKLQTDPSVIYAVTNGEMNLGRPLSKRDLAYDSPYNTYLYEGLPPTPICSPGQAALYAAAHPDKTEYFYFVADGVSGGHRFAKTLSEHNKNVMMYRKSKR